MYSADGGIIKSNTAGRVTTKSDGVVVDGEGGDD
jgi:hypothetical protein